MGADAFLVGLACHGEGAAHDVFILLRFAVAGLCFLPLKFGEVPDTAVFHDQLRFDPICPVTGQPAFVGDDEVKLFRAIERHIDGDGALFAFRGKDLRLKDRFYLRLRGQRQRGGEGDKDEGE